MKTKLFFHLNGFLEIYNLFQTTTTKINESTSFSNLKKKERRFFQMIARISRKTNFTHVAHISCDLIFQVKLNNVDFLQKKRNIEKKLRKITLSFLFCRRQADHL